MEIIKDKKIVADEWTVFDGDGESVVEAAEDKVIYPYTVYAANQESLKGKAKGILLDSDNHPEDIQDDLESFELIAINFPTFMDGRGYSYAKILRDRFAYEGELRAVGDVLRDQLFYMARCGFNAFKVKEGKDINDAIKGLDDFSVKYQVSVDEKLPLYRRR